MENYARRVKYATCKRFGVEKEKIRLMLWAVLRDTQPDPARGAETQRQPVEPQAAAQGLHRLCGLRLLVGAAVPGLGVREGDDLQPGTAARERGCATGRLGSHRAAGVSDFAAERVCESSHMTDKIKFLRAF